ncbi:hypothetical protein H6G89_04875 [Oscillatoria sp. FACHB-1407]|uniref:hypothetical protein n=1 Tax=Oscillatoria sp. FACHB-1407 TaxID=2692847 RepID=UPI001686405E|nr:hypothetical protein [Oscillatoria sp. FACHB-1407]MBD2460371.1 hypothetical protein [Oscillatoria sp. FACHB-1407]
MVTLTAIEVDEYRTALADDADALRALEVVEDCDGDLEDAAIVLALRTGQEPDRSDQWLESVAKRWRTALCGSTIRTALETRQVAMAVRSLTTEAGISIDLAVPIVLFVLKTGIDDFCRPLEEKLS